MHRIRVDHLEPGEKLGVDIYSFNGQLLLTRGTVITNAHLDSFTRQGITRVYIMDSMQEPYGKSRGFSEIYHYSLDTVRSFMTGVKLGRPLPQPEVEGVVETLLEQVFDETNVFGQLSIMRDKDEYLFTHSVNVSILGILIARWLKCDKSTTKLIGMAGMLHDIGKVLIAPEILRKPGALTPEEFEEIKKHTIMGLELVSKYGWIESSISNAVLMHHEKLDGSGYPLGARGEAISFMTRIVAVADVYDAITSTRVYSPKQTPFKAAEVLWEESFGKLDPKITKVLCDHAADFYVGQKVKLSNGEEGLVVFIDRSHPTRPLIQVGDKFYNLNQDRSVTIEEILE